MQLHYILSIAGLAIVSLIQSSQARVAFNEALNLGHAFHMTLDGFDTALKRRNSQYLTSQGLVTNDQTQAAVYNIVNGQLLVNGQIVSADSTDLFVPFAPIQPLRSVTTTWGFNGNLVWSNSQFLNGQAFFCQDLEGQVYVVLVSSPQGCTTVAAKAVPALANTTPSTLPPVDSATLTIPTAVSSVPSIDTAIQTVLPSITLGTPTLSVVSSSTDNSVQIPVISSSLPVDVASTPTTLPAVTVPTDFLTSIDPSFTSLSVPLPDISSMSLPLSLPLSLPNPTVLVTSDLPTSYPVINVPTLSISTDLPANIATSGLPSLNSLSSLSVPDITISTPTLPPLLDTALPPGSIPSVSGILPSISVTRNLPSVPVLSIPAISVPTGISLSKTLTQPTEIVPSIALPSDTVPSIVLPSISIPIPTIALPSTDINVPTIPVSATGAPDPNTSATLPIPVVSVTLIPSVTLPSLAVPTIPTAVSLTASAAATVSANVTVKFQTAPVILTEYAGCYTDGSYVDDESYVSLNMSNNICITHCADLGLPLSATNGNTCTCGSSFALLSPPLELPGIRCNATCPGNITETCGGIDAASLYNRTSSYLYEYGGCFSQGPYVNPIETSSVNNSLALCDAQCSGNVLGLQGTNCFCGDAYVSASTVVKVDESLCTTPCPGDSSMTCGATNYTTQYFRVDMPS